MPLPEEPDEELLRLCGAWRDDALTADELRQLEDRLRREPGARQFFCRFVELHAALERQPFEAETVFSVVLPPEIASSHSRPPLQPSQFLSRPLALAAAFVLLLSLTGAWLWHVQQQAARHAKAGRAVPAAPKAQTDADASPGRRAASDGRIQVEQAAGWVLWSDGTGGKRRNVKLGDLLGAGYLETVGESASARVRFADGTVCNLGGDTSIFVSAEGQKIIQLKSGLLALSAARQPAGQPLLLHTPTADLEVLGTVFEVSASAKQTQLAVQEGRVRMRRLADGREVEVAASQVARATLDAGEKIESHPRPAATSQWRADFVKAPADNWVGEWRAPEPGQSGRLSAVPYVAWKNADGSLITRHGVRAERAGALAEAPLTVTTNSVLTVRWRTARPAEILVMVGCSHPDRRFGGNYQFRLPATKPDTAGWRETRCLLAAFQALQQNDLTTAPLRIHRLTFSAAFAADGLEVAELGFEGGQRP